MSKFVLSILRYRFRKSACFSPPSPGAYAFTPVTRDYSIHGWRVKGLRFKVQPSFDKASEGKSSRFPVMFGTGIILILFMLTGCESLVVKPAGQDSHLEDFEAAWNRINDVYPFLEFKGIDWDSIYAVYRTRVEAAQGDEFYLVFHDFLAELKDGHTWYRTDGGGKIYPFYPDRHFKDRHGYNPFVVRSYFNTELIVTESRVAEYGILPGNIGYLFISGFHEDYLINEFAGILDYLKDTDGLIIDIRQKRGGSYQNVEAVVTRFMTEPLERPKLYFLGEFIDIPPFQPSGPYQYTEPVVILINGSTFSAGELTTEIMKQLPQVTAIGDTTGGGGAASSDDRPERKGAFKLPGGKYIYIGTGYFERYDGELFEWNGVPPDIRVEQTGEHAAKGIDRQLETAIGWIKAQK
ncbi:MAG: hypothetical protein JXR52_06165 [Bacteroidales bacterium]|nr:hypothetical protein [Bacteroidales bacterium]MBN2698392.1 hypothetical protein [Bacteroidales bacterium]